MSAAETSASPFQSFKDGWKRISERVHWKKQLHHSGLPRDVIGLIQEVLLASRLWRHEKSEIAVELIAHFHDGHQLGRDYSDLIEDFGEPRVIATLIRRAKLRNRPMYMKLLKGFGFGVAGMVSAYIALALFFNAGKPNPVINYMSQLNYRTVDLDEAEMAWPIYRPVWTKYGFCEGGGFRCESIFDLANGSSSMLTPDHENWPVAVKEISQYEELLDNFREGAKLPALGLNLELNRANYSDEDFACLFPGQNKADVPNDENAAPNVMVGVLLPHIQSFRKAARLLKFDSRIAVTEQDSARVVDNIKTCFGLGRQASDRPILVNGLVGIAVIEIGFQQLEEALEQDPNFFTEEQLAELQSAVESIAVRNLIDFEGERAMVKDIIQHCYTDNGKGDGRITANGISMLANADSWLYGNSSDYGEYTKVRRVVTQVAAPASIFVCATRKQCTEKLDEIIDLTIADSQLPFWQSRNGRPGGWDDVENFYEEEKYKYFLLSMLMPATQQVNNAMYRTLGRQEGIVAALAIHRFYVKHDQWPEQFTDVSPEFVAEFPQDQQNGSLVKFTYQDDKLLVYSVGNDYDDDGGIPQGHVAADGSIQMSHDTVLSPKRDDMDGDWILWPQSALE